MAVFGQTNMAAAFEENSPDYVVIIARNASEFGVGYFGYYRGYGTELKRWIDGHYDRVYPAEPTGKSPSGNNPFFRTANHETPPARGKTMKRPAIQP